MVDRLAGIQSLSRTGYKGIGRIDAVGPATIRAPQGASGLGAAMQDFVKAGGALYGQYADAEKSKADERSNEMLRKLGNKTLREGIADGSILYQDDQDAMKLLRQKIGRGAAFDIESEMQQKVANGEFRTREDLQAYRDQRLQDGSKSVADTVGLVEMDEDYQRGFNSDILQRNAGIYDAHAQWRSKQLQAESSVAARKELQPLMEDPQFLGSKDGAYIVSNYINKGLENRTIPSDQQAISTVTLLANDAIARDGGAQFLREFQQKKINVLGGETTVEQLMGKEAYEELISKADEQVYKRNAKKQENISLGIANALAQDDPAEKWQKLNALEQQNDLIQGGEQMTAVRQQIIQAKAQAINEMKQNTLRNRENVVKQTQADNRMAALEDAFQRRIGGESISTDPKYLAVDDNTGPKYLDSDKATHAAWKLNQIDQMDIPDDKKDDLKLKYLYADSENGAFKAHFKTLVEDAGREWQGALVRKAPGDFTKIKELQRVYAKDPAIIAQLYPEQAGLLETVNSMGENGLDPQVLIDQENSRKGVDKDEMRFRNEQWAAVKNDSAAPELKFLGENLDKQARAVYDAYVYRTGDANEASRMVTQYLQKVAVNFTEDPGTLSSTRFHGTVAKADLMVDPDDVKSWETGKQIVDDTVQQLAKESVWGNTGISISADQGQVVIQSMNGQRLVIDRNTFQNLGRDRRAVAEQQRLESKTKDAKRQQDRYDQWMRGGVPQLNR